MLSFLMLSFLLDIAITPKVLMGKPKRNILPYPFKPVFHFNRIVMKRSVLFREHSGRTNDMDIVENGTFRYDTVEVENDL